MDDAATPDDVWVIHPQWRRWAAENLARGAATEEVVATLVEAGAAPEPARELVARLEDDVALAVARSLARRVAALETIVRLRLEHRQRAPAPSTVERRTLPSVEELVGRYWVPGVPVVLTDVVTGWPAFGRWGLHDLRERFGDAKVEVCMGRTAVERPDAQWRRLRHELTIAELVERIESGPPGNDVYMIARNNAFLRADLAALLDDIVLPPEIFGPALAPSRMGLWIGSAGTHSPMHHDGDNSALCQVVGRKRVRLAPPESLAMLDHAEGVYSRWDPLDPEPIDDGPERLLELVLAPGELLLIPAGWWHQVDALDFSMTVNVLEFAWPNDYAWFRPGRALRGGG
jgi:hypothetical protein